MTLFGTEMSLTWLTVGLLGGTVILMIVLMAGAFVYAANRSRNPGGGTNSSKQSSGSRTSVQNRFSQSRWLMFWIIAAIAVFGLTWNFESGFQWFTTYGITIAIGITLLVFLGVISRKKPTWLWPIAFIGLVVALGYFWTPIEAKVTEWLPASKAGMALGITGEDIGVWLWVFAIAVIVMAALALLPGALGLFGRFANITVIALAVVALAIVNLTQMTPVGWLSSTNQTISKGGNCTTHKRSLDYQFDEVGLDITVCPDERYFFLYQGNNRPLSFEISPDFMKERGHLFRSKDDWKDCFTVIPPEEGNSQQGSYRVIPKKGSGSCFVKRGINKIDIHVYAVM